MTDEPFSWTNTKLEAIIIKQRRARTKAKNQDVDFKLRHPAESRDASGDNPNYTRLNQRIKDEVETQQALILTRRAKFVS